jgi:spore maturation protein CgeB
MLLLLHDDEIAASFAQVGLDSIRSHHTCTHRVQELLTIIAAIKGQRIVEQSPAAQHGVLAS